MRKRRTESQSYSIWRSYSDMMCGVLLLFVLIMCVTMFQAQKSYNDTIQERDEKIALQEQYALEILAKQNELDEKNGEIEDQSEQIKTQDEKLTEQAELVSSLLQQLEEKQLELESQQVELDTKSSDLEEKNSLLKEQEEEIASQKLILEEKTTQLEEQQLKIDKIIGVKAEVIEALENEFKENNLSVNIDTQTGAMMLESNVMFNYDQAELTDQGKSVLEAVLPIYCKVLLKDAYRPYLAEIMIDGYTDDDGDYAYNLELSQKRSLEVAKYLLTVAPQHLEGTESEAIKSYLTVNGHSSANPVLDSNGQVDKEASRRVEVKFRLKDEEMISELNDILLGEYLDAEKQTEAVTEE